MRNALTYCCQGYAAVTLVAVGVTALWAIGVIDASMPLVGYAWFAVAALGVLVTVSIGFKRGTAIEADSNTDRIEGFEENPLTGRPLDVYIGALAAWAAVSFEWVLGGMSASGVGVVGYGWLAIAVYGLVIAITIAVHHGEDVATAIDPTKRLDRTG